MSTKAPGGSPPPASPEDDPDRSPSPEDQRAAGRLRLYLPIAVIVLLVGGAAALVATGSSSKQQLPDNAKSVHSGRFDGSLLQPARQAPPLSSLRNYQGRPVNLTNYRGKAVFVTFLYTHCPDVCPLIASQLHNAVSRLGSRAGEVQLVAVSVDPRGDTSASVGRFLKEHQLTGQMQYLIGSAAELAPVWQAWGVGSQRDAGNPEFINHSALVYGISASGKLTTIYPSNLNPPEIDHDVPLLLAS
ncbi:MAG TPA: SCO family protein [Solirubrobacteraceae bacterium]|nr:SCO family protein [Solirubrobacteraceae bacterium]